MIRLKNITKEYRVADQTIHALGGVSLDFRPNEFVAVLGPSGCGKTTMMNIVGGLDKYTSGDLIVDGKSTKDFRDGDWDNYRNKKIGFVFQSYNLIPHLTVLDNVELALTLSGVSAEERRARAKDALERVGLARHMKNRPNQLSGGQMQRVAIARALVNSPDILLADEPTGALDTKTSEQILDLINEVAKDRLVIMVTHNPELAARYSTRVIKLVDGEVVSDSNPYDADAPIEEEPAAAEEPVLPVSSAGAPAHSHGKERTSMSFATALSLSGRNLLTKKGRTLVTAIAGSIGIIGVCLVLALSSGFNHYIHRTEENMLSSYPLEVSETALNAESIMNTFMGAGEQPDGERLNDRVYVNSFLSKLAGGMTVSNNLSDEYFAYLDAMDGTYYNARVDAYGNKLTNNIYTEFAYDYQDAAKKSLMSLDTIKSIYTSMLITQGGEYRNMAQMIGMLGNVYNELPDNPAYVQSQYEILDGKYPSAYNEVALVVDRNNGISDLMLAQLGYYSTADFLALFEDPDGAKSEFALDELIGSSFTYYNNDEVYQEIDAGNFLYKSIAMHGYELTGGQKITVVGILRPDNDEGYGALSSGIAYTKALTDRVIADSTSSGIVEYMHDTGVESLRLQMLDINSPNTNYVGTIDLTLRELGGVDTPSSVRFYAKDFATKDKLTAYLDAWNAAHEEGEQVTYTDSVAMVVNMMTTIINAITYVLVAFTAISLVVSSVMIGVITYISVVERTKEIGILRAIGARKKDIKRLFNAETFIIGLLAGVIGVAFTYFASIFINILLHALTGISGIAALPWWQAIVMVAVSFILTLISGLIPASAAAKKDPVIALRTE